MALFQEDPDIRQRVLSGEWDFQDVALSQLQAQGGRRHVPAPVRSPNHTETRRSFQTMSDKEFEDFNRRIDAGEVFDARK